MRYSKVLVLALQICYTNKGRPLFLHFVCLDRLILRVLIENLLLITESPRYYATAASRTSFFLVAIPQVTYAEWGYPGQLLPTIGRLP